MKRALLLILAGCGAETADPSTRIDAPRVLGIQADPPVVAAGDVAQLRLLAVDATGEEATATPSWRACSPWTPVADPTRDCGPGASLALDGALDVDALLARFPAPAPLPPPPDDPCPLAYAHVDVPVIVELDVDGTHLTARKNVRLSSTPIARTNPALGDLLREGDSLSVHPLVDSLDEACTSDTPPAIVREPLSVFLFTTAGDLGATHVDVSYDAAGTESLGTTTFVTDAPTVILWAVAIDPDGGLDWARYLLSLASP